MEARDRFKFFYGKIGWQGRRGPLEKNTGTSRVGEFGYILGNTSTYPKFSHLLDALMGSFPKALMDELRKDVFDHTIDIW